MDRPASSPYRWVVLLALFLVTVVSQVQWLANDNIAHETAVLYGFDSVMPVNRLAEAYLLIYLVACIPASWAIFRLGTRVGLGIGAALLGLGSVVKGVWADSYAFLLAGQVILAFAQPFILNAPTAVASSWFPVSERGTAVGLALLAQFVGMLLALAISPWAIQVDGVADPARIPGLMATYGWASLAAAVLCLVLMREGPGKVERDALADVRGFFKGVRHILSLRDVRRTVLMFFVGLGVFNAVLICIGSIGALKSLDKQQSDMLGPVVLLGGVVGAVVLPVISDRIRRRKAVLAASLVAVVPSLAGLAWSADYGTALAFSFLVGFFVTGAGPVGFQYAAEVGGPATESTSQGLMLLAGQVSGLVFAEVMGMKGLLQPVLWVFVGLSALTAVLSLTLRESPAMAAGDVTRG